MAKIDIGTLSYVAPRPSSFMLAAVPDREFNLRAVGLDDQLWMQKTFGDELKNVFTYCKFGELTRIVFHQLRPEDQAFFGKQEVTFVNEEGETLKKHLGGVSMLQSLIVGPKEALDVVSALTEAIGVSKPLLDELEKAELKANQEKKSLIEPTGDISSTSSLPNTDGQPPK